MWGLIGDSSLYCKEGTKRRSIKDGLWRRLPFVRELKVTPLAGKGLPQILTALKDGPRYAVLGVSYFGNDLGQGISSSLEDALEELMEVASRKADKAVFFIGGSARKYKDAGMQLDHRYDESLAMIRRRLRHAGFSATSGRSEVERWPLCQDCLHWDVSAREDVCSFWAQLLTSAATAVPAPRDPPSRSTGDMHLELGDEVEIQGLVSASKHNGKRGVIVQRVLPKTAGGEVPYRWRVKCLEGGSEPLLLDLKEGNLRQASTPMPAPPTESMPRLNREATTPTEIFVDSASEAGSTASMSSQSQADSEKFRTFAIAVFRQTAAERLGIRVESVSGTGFDDAARVHRIFSGGLIDKWNKEVTEMDLPDWVVQVDDVIAGLNGRRNFTTTCQEVQEATVLNLLIIRGWPFPGIDV